MGYWITGGMEGHVILGVEVQFLVVGVESPHHSAEWFAADLEHSELLEELDPDIPYEWVQDGQWTIKRVSLVREELSEDDGDREADYSVTVEFHEIPIPLLLEGMSEKLTCIGWSAGYSVPMRELVNELRSSAEAVGSITSVRVISADVRALFTGKGEDGKEFNDIKIDCAVPNKGRRWFW